jgi:histidine decarboxylase
MGLEGLKNRYLQSLKVALYCKKELLKLGIEAWSNEGSITVVLPKTSDAIKEKWQLATEEEVTHVICMPNVTKEQIDMLVGDLKKEKEACLQY